MAAWLELKQRLQTLQEAENFHIEALYRGVLPAWLATAWSEVQAAAKDKAPLLALNVKGAKPDDVAVVMRLADLERLLDR
jgi:hypothetical protein